MKYDYIKIGYLATKIMGWEKHKGYYVMGVPGRVVDFAWWADGEQKELDTWNPLRDWGDWRMVEEKIMKDKNLFASYIACIPSVMREKGVWEEWPYSPSRSFGKSMHITQQILMSSLDVRVDALIAAHRTYG